MERGKKRGDLGRGDEGLENLAQRLVEVFTDPTLPCNQLRRPTWRTCLHCGGKWRSTVSMLCESPFCSDGCQIAFEELLS